MANQGCPHEGKDHRLFGRWGCRIQTALSWHTETPPTDLLHTTLVDDNQKDRGWLIVRMPPYVSLGVKVKENKWFSLRFGVRWDPHWEWFDEKAGKGKSGGYIFPEFIIKVMDHVVY